MTTLYAKYMSASMKYGLKKESPAALQTGVRRACELFASGRRLEAESLRDADELVIARPGGCDARLGLSD